MGGVVQHDPKNEKCPWNDPETYMNPAVAGLPCTCEESKMSKDKSVLDDVPVKESDSFSEFMNDLKKPPKGGSSTAPPKGKELLFIVGACPKCGAPIYGPKVVQVGGERPVVQHSCNCGALAAFKDQVQIK